VTLATNELATIYYTTDGSTPTEASSVYTSPIAIPTAGSVKFFAIDRAGNREVIRAYGPSVGQVGLQISSVNSATVNFVASASGGSGSYEYQYRLLDPQYVWSIVRPYGATSTWSWDKTGVPAGSYNVVVWARNAGTTVEYDAITWVTLTISENRAPVLTDPGSQVNDDGSVSYTEAVLTDAPAVYWRLSDTVGLSVPDTAGGSPGTVVGGATLSQSGALTSGNVAMLFDGSTGFVRITKGPALQLAGDLTIELWLNVPLATRQTLISKHYLHEFELTLETTGRLTLYQGNGTTYDFVVSAVAITPNTWQHVVVTRVAATKTVRFYVNGAAAGSGTYMTTPTVGTDAISIGRSNFSLTQYVKGRLGEIALYPSALSAAQIETHYGLRPFTATGASIELQLTANDPNGDSLTYHAIGLPPGLALNAATGLISGTLSPGSVGVHQVMATASDGRLSASQTFTWTVTHVNRTPTLLNPGTQTSAEGASISLSLGASDPDGDALAYSVTGLPVSLSLDPSGRIAGTLSFRSAGTYTVTATVSDGSLSSSQTFTWIVGNTNRAPILSTPGSQINSDVFGYAEAVVADAPVGYWRLGETAGIGAADSVGTNPGTAVGGVTLGQSGALADGNPAMLFNGSTSYVRVANSPAVQLAGDLTIELWLNVSLATRQTLVSKDYQHEFELTLETTGRLTLYQGNGSTSDFVISSVAITANTWQHVVVTRTAASKTVRFYVNGVATSSGTYATTPNTGTNAISIGRSSFSLTRYVNGRIDEVAIYPAALSAAQAAAHYALGTSVGTSTVVALPLTASDPDGDGLTYSAKELPAGLTVNPATGLISGTLSTASAGVHQVTATAADGSLSASQTFTWTVTHVINHTPTLTNPGSQMSAEGASISLSLGASDPDGDALSYGVTGLPVSLSLDPATGLVSGTLSFTSAGTYLVTASVSDGSLLSSQIFTWTVAKTVPANPGIQANWDISSYAAAVLADAPVGYWRLGETTGTNAADRAGANPGILVGGVTLGQSGALADANLAMLFNGSTGYVQVANSPSVKLAGDLTIELWLNTSLATRQTLISKDYQHEFELTLETTGRLTLYQGNGTTSDFVSSVVAITANAWQHVVVTRTAASKTVRFYVNGVAMGSGSYVTTPTTGINAVSIGRSSFSLTRYVNGRLDEVALYPTALSAAQIGEHYARRTFTDGP
jgi:hypothetical protein